MIRETAQDKNLSPEALGILTYLLSKPDTWAVNVDDLKRKGCSRDRVYRIIHELCAAGYMRMASKRQDEKTKRWLWNPYLVSEYPEFKNQQNHAKSEEPYPEMSDTEKPEIKEHNTEGTESTLLSSRVTRALNGAGKRLSSEAEKIPTNDEKSEAREQPAHREYFAVLMNITWPGSMFVPSNSLMGRVAKWLRTNGYQPQEGGEIVDYVAEIAQKDEWKTRWHLTCVETFAADWQARVRDDPVLTPLLRKKLKLLNIDPDAPGIREAIARGGYDLDTEIRERGLEVPV
jgi:hypothetical protein